MSTVAMNPEARVQLYIADMTERGVPAHLIESLAWYLVTGRPVGGFLTAVLTNDLRECVKRGDDNSLAGLVALVRYLYNRAPMGAWGSPEHVRTWAGMPHLPVRP